MKKISEECDKKVKQATELLANLEHLKESLSSSEADRQVSTTSHNYGAWSVVVKYAFVVIGTLEHNSLVGRQAC